ncbi:MAG: hypothetical protein IIB07_08485, partial [Bacteroidetes bacterium]|nr:hypothetical protein [Bacteroidota bacterium]
MKILITLLISIAAFAFVNAQKLSGTKVKKTYYSDGKIKTQGDYWYDKLDGEYLEFYPSGKLWKKWKFKDGVEEGKSEWYFPDGKLSIVWNYRNGKKNGTSKWHYE